jgi:zinc protease
VRGAAPQCRRRPKSTSPSHTFGADGGADDPLGKSGIAHFLEHLMFKGTTAAPSGAFTALISRNGGRDNAFTTQDYTAFHEAIL